MSTAHLPPGLLSIHVLPADHHDGPWDHIRDAQAGTPNEIDWPAVERPTWP